MEMSITRALAELKLLDKRIQKEINATTNIGMTIGGKPMTGFSSVKEFEDKVKSNYQSVKDLIARRQKIKNAIVKSNAETFVTIAGNEMTVAEAIEYKSSIDYKKHLLNKLEDDYRRITVKYEQESENVKIRLDKFLESSFGKEFDKKKDEAERIKESSDGFMRLNEPKLVDPLDIKKQIEELSKHIDEFESEVDFTLSESNTITKITIE